MHKRILIVEDDVKLANLVREYLEGHGYQVAVEGRGDKAVSRIVDEAPDLVILDLMLPGLDGLSVCREVRQQYQGPILMLTARGEEVDEVVGLEVGADDYMAKPVRPRLLAARVGTLLRRSNGGSTPKNGGRRIEVGPLSIDANARTVVANGNTVDLTTAEFDLLWLLASHRGEVVSREYIFKELRGIEYDGIDRSMDLRISRLRDKLDDQEQVMLKSVRGVGYILAAPA